MVKRIEKYTRGKDAARAEALPALSVIWFASDSEEKNRTTAEALLHADGRKSFSLIIYLHGKFDEKKEHKWLDSVKEAFNCTVAFTENNTARPVLYNHARSYVHPFGYTTVVESGDSFSDTYFSDILSRTHKNKSNSYEDSIYRLLIGRKLQRDGKEDPLSSRTGDAVQDIGFSTKYGTVPYRMAGTVFSSDEFISYTFREDLVYEYEKVFLLKLALKTDCMCYVRRVTYNMSEITEFDTRNFQGYYEEAWYRQAIDEVWLPFLGSVKEEYGRIPLMLQHMAFYALQLRTIANLNNNNKHVIPDAEAMDYIRSWSRMLQYVDDAVIMDAYSQVPHTKESDLKRFFLQVKYDDPDYQFQITHMDRTPYYGAGEYVQESLLKKAIEIVHLECVHGTLHVEGVLSGLYDLSAGSFSVMCGDYEIPVRFTERYTHTKLFGVSIYKQRPFELYYDLADVQTQRLRFMYTDDIGEYRIPLQFSSHWSKLTEKLKNAYWCFAYSGVQYMMTYNTRSLLISRISRRTRRKRERKLRFEMLKTRNKEIIKLLLYRMLYFFFESFLHRHPIWMFYDKIYKGGDSAEYMYRYAEGQKDGIRKYYLIDRKAPDYRHLVNDGYRPLVRGTLKHRLIFLYADLMIVSNSTVCEFNDLPAARSAYLRDLINFHVVCVQHGMSVQKIAVAQNRLRDNTRLYFCASKYELDNLYRPIYDYRGHHALKLTGVPRYDGLINRDQRQILITPTWRMQAALAPNGNEGVERAYNPGFKKSSYFKVYNALLNDKRLIEAAKQYHYRIVYVLHPIVSPQLKDFTKNEYVDLIPSTGDMSYEKVFCESSLMVTDFSGVQFDFAYMRKPVVYFHSDEIPQHYEEGTFHYDTMGFGEICRNSKELIDLLIDYMQHDCEMKDEYRRRADDFFSFSDRNNCKRIYDVMLPYTQELMEAKKENRFRTFPQAVHHTALEGDLIHSKLQKQFKLDPESRLMRYARGFDRRLSMLVRRSYCQDEEIRKNRIFMMTYDSNFICNPKYIAEALLRRKLDVEIYWAIPQNGRVRKESFPPQIRLVRRNSEAMLHAMATSRIWIENAMDIPLYGIRKREGQVFMNTWHGSLGIKKLSGDDAWLKRASKVGAYTDYCITNSEFEENVFRTTFWPETPFLKYGHARNDLFFNRFVMWEKKQQVMEYYNLPEDRKLFLYAPTFRENGMGRFEEVNFGQLKQVLEEHFGGEWSILVRWHHKERLEKMNALAGEDVIDASDYGDMQELLPAIDAGMSDYSSWVYDFMLTKRPIFLYVPDIGDYDQARGFYYPLETTPFPLARTNAGLAKLIGSFDEEKYQAAVDAFLKDKGCYEDGQAAERITDKIAELIQA